MSAMTSIQSNTIYFEHAMRSQLETLEAENRSELKERETEMHEIKLDKARDSRIIEELRPLCEELPPDALDPVTIEPLDDGMVFRCGHVLNVSTICSIARMNKLTTRDPMKCPSCNLRSAIEILYDCHPLRGCVDILKKISEVFKKYT